MRKSVVVSLLLSFLFFGLHAQFKNSKLSDIKEGNYPPTGPGVVVNQKNPDNIVAGVSPHFAYYTIDGGKTWNESILISPNGVAGGPALISDVKGSIYFFHRSDPGTQGKASEGWLDRIGVHKTTDGGKTWEEGEPVGLNSPKDQDYPQASAHPKKSDVYLSWTQFDKQSATDSSCHAAILFSMSSSGGKKWSKPVQISPLGNCVEDDNTPAGATTTVDLDGRVFAAWASKGSLYFDRSFDGGANWLSNDIVLGKQGGGWSMNIPGMGKTNGKPMTTIDNSTGAYHNLIYVMWADQQNGENDTDIWMMRSTNRGDNWTERLKVNQDSSKHHQFLPKMTIDQTTGYIYVVYYDRREHDNLQTDVYLSYSSDGGNHYTDVKISEAPFTPSEEKFLSDYNSISAHKGVIAVAWTRTDNGVNSVWTTVIKQEELAMAKPHSKKSK